ncbi:MAG: site-specific integrase [Methanobrevibacter sp.]|nr:site-specific integrase [Methanobrevibacter sp.]
MEKYTSASVRQTKTGKWQARLRYKENGKWKNLDRILPDAKGKRDANRMAEDLRREMNEAAAKLPSKTQKTVGEVVLDYLEYQLSLGVIERSTYKHQVNLEKRYIDGYISDIIFDTLDRTSIMNWHAKLSGEGLSQGTIHDAFVLMKKTYNYYIYTGEITKNPFNTVKMPTRAPVRTTHLTDNQMTTFLSACYQEYDEDSPYLIALLLAYYQGLRRGEICGLRWIDIDYDANTLTVSSAIGEAYGGYYSKMPKSKSSNRVIPMMPQMAEALKKRYEAIQPDNSWFVVGDGTRFMNPKRLWKHLNKFFEAYNLVDAYGKPITLHSLRHSFASTGVRSGMDIAVLSAILGHASKALTLDVYSDPSEESKRVGVKRLAQTFKKTDLDL